MDNTNVKDAPKLILLQDEPRGPSQLLSVPINTAGSIFKFPVTQELMSDANKTIIIKGFRLLSNKVLATDPNSTNANATLAELRKMTVTIYSEGWNKAQNVPILEFNDVVDQDSTAATTIPYRNKSFKVSDWTRVEWNKCFIQFSTAPAGTPYSVIFEVEYERIDANGNVILGPA